MLSPTSFIAILVILLPSVPAVAQQPLIAQPAISQQPPISLSSPGGNLQASIFSESTHHLGWSLRLNGKSVVLPSALGVDIGPVDLGQDVEFGAPVFSVNNTTYPWKGVHSTAINHYRQALIPIRQKRTGIRYTLECRIFDDGFAFRYLVPPGAGGARVRRDSGSLVTGGDLGTRATGDVGTRVTGGVGTRVTGDVGTRVTGESSSWHLPGGSRVWYQENVYYYEGLHYTSLIDELGYKQLGPPVTFQTADGNYATITEAALYNYSGMSLRSDTGNILHAAFINDPNGWTIHDTVISPWRVILASDHLDGLVNSDIITDLNPAPDTAYHAAYHTASHAASWVRPGRAVWSYFVHDNVTTLDLEKSYVDKAAALGFEYSIVDAGWDSSWPDAFDSLGSLVRYAGRKHVGIFVWKSYASLKDDSIRKTFFRDMRRLGVAGLKIDYIDKEGIDQVRFYEKALRDGLAFHLMIDFHGANKPTGYNRRFPNEITREGIYGQEWRTYTPQGPINNAIIPFTRFLAGPADYTPGVFDSRLAYGTSRAQQLALTVIYNSPLLCWADDPAVYLASPAVDVVRSIPTTWDETRVLALSRIGEIVAFARRKGTDWFLGIINAGDFKRLDLPLSFLGRGVFRAEIIGDDMTNSDRILRSVTSYTSSDTLPVILNARGGFVARLTRTNEPPAAITIRPAGGYLQGPLTVRIVVRPGVRTSTRPGATAGTKPGGGNAARPGGGGNAKTAFIRYTTDGSEPDSRSRLYAGDLTVAGPALIRARVFRSASGGDAGTLGSGALAADVVAQFLAAPAPAVSPAGGIFIGRQAVSLSTGLQGEMRYTTDGSEPNATSPLYKDPIRLDASTTLKSRVFFAAGGAGEISTFHFEKVTPDPAVGASAPDSLAVAEPAKPAADSLAADGGLAGLGYTYYEGKWDSMPLFSRLTPIKQGRVLLPSLDSIASRANEYGLQFKGWITIPETGVYTFYTVSDDGSQLYIGDQKLVDNDGCHGDLERSGDRALMAGIHPFTLDYFQNSSGQTLQVFIKGPHLEKQPVPAAWFSAR